MYISVSNSRALNSSEIVGVFDLDNTTQRKITVDFLTKKQEDGLLFEDNSAMPRSFILTKDGKVYLSDLTKGTIEKHGGL